MQEGSIHLVHTRCWFVILPVRHPWVSILTSYSTGYVQWIEQALIKAVQLAPSSLTISICIFVTGSPSTADADLPDSVVSSPVEKQGAPEHIVSKRDSSPSLSSLRGVKLEIGRPNLDALLKEEISSASGRLSVSGKYLGARLPGCTSY